VTIIFDRSIDVVVVKWVMLQCSALTSSVVRAEKRESSKGASAAGWLLTLAEMLRLFSSSAN
jgi:hypothetical protein